MDTSGKAFIKHWEWAAEKGLVKANTARSLSAASKQVLMTAFPEEWEQMDVLTIDADEAIQRFENLRMKDYKPRTLDQYGRRFRRALEYFEEYIEEPSKWRPFEPRSSRSSRSEDGESKSPALKNEEDGSWSKGSDGNSQGMITYPYPLREGVIVRMLLPVDLTKSEVARLHSFMSTLVGSSSGGDAMA